MMCLRQSKRHDVAPRAALFDYCGKEASKYKSLKANLYTATVDGDAETLRSIVQRPLIRPDELKLYPCSLIPHTELMRHYEAGRWRPYDRDELLDLLVRIMPMTPEYCRLSRVIRDIPADSMHTDSHGTL